MFSVLFKIKRTEMMLEILGESSTNCYDGFHKIETLIKVDSDFSIAHLQNVMIKYLTNLIRHFEFYFL